MSKIITAERCRLGLSQTELAKKLGVDVGTVSRWERDQGLVKSRDLIALSRILGCSVDYLLGLSDIRTRGQN